MIYLAKTLPLFFLPVGLTLILILAGLVTGRRMLFLGALLLLYTAGMPLVGRQALQMIEGDLVRELPQEVSSADAIVVLSGGRVLAPGITKISEWTDADRFFGGVELYKAGKAPFLVFTGGAAPWEPAAPSEGEILVRFAQDFGVPYESMMTTGKVFNTADEAEAVAGLLGDRLGGEDETHRVKILLVTSAFHMPRAKAQFEAVGLQVEVFPVDFLVPAERQLTTMDFLPTSSALNQTELALREFYGRMFYWIRHGKS
jgi:uncharacterized SAM-binding protein YcdF (DUF218 family)